MHRLSLVDWFLALFHNITWETLVKLYSTCCLLTLTGDARGIPPHQPLVGGIPRAAVKGQPHGTGPMLSGRFIVSHLESLDDSLGWFKAPPHHPSFPSALPDLFHAHSPCDVSSGEAGLERNKRPGMKPVVLMFSMRLFWSHIGSCHWLVCLQMITEGSGWSDTGCVCHSHFMPPPTQTLRCLPL